MTLRAALASTFLLSETDDDMLLLRPRTGSGRGMLLVLSEATRAGLEVADENGTAAADVLRAIGEARGRERFLVLQGERLTPSISPASVIRDVASDDDTTRRDGAWSSYDPPKPPG